MSSLTVPAVCQLVGRPDPLPDILIANGISLLIGAPNIGKTALLASLFKSLRDGTPFFGHQPNAVPALGLVSADRGWEGGGGAWFGRVGYPDVPHYSMTDDPLFEPRTLRRKFARTELLGTFTDRLQLPLGSLLGIDPISLFLGGNLLDYDSVACALSEIRRMNRQRQLSAIGTAHTAKLKADRKDRYLRLTDQILGSTALSGFSDSLMYLASPEELNQAYYVLLIHSHRAPQQTIKLERDELGLFRPFVGEENGGRTNMTRVLALIPSGGAEIAVDLLRELALPISPRTLERVLKALKAEGKIERVARGFVRRVVED
jgi:hypothetical protein